MIYNCFSPDSSQAGGDMVRSDEILLSQLDGHKEGQPETTTPCGPWQSFKNFEKERKNICIHSTSFE